MRKYMKEELERRYNEIFRKYYTEYMIELKNKYENLLEKRLDKSGVAVKVMYDVVEKEVYEVIENLDNLISEINTLFEPITLTDLSQYIDRSKKNINSSIDKMESIICEKLGNDKLLNIETIKQKSNNIKQNNIHKLNQIYLKNKNINSFKKIEWLVIINTIATVGGFILTIISFFI